MNTPSSHPSLLGARRAGFTLIELLTVIAIIGILAAILIPVVGKVRMSAQSAKTISNVRQLQQANRMHATDYKGFFVPIAASNETLSVTGTPAPNFAINPHFLNYLSQKTNSWEDPQSLTRTGKTSANPNGVTIGISLANSIFPQRAGFKDSDVDRVAPRMIMFGDSQSWMLAGTRVAAAEAQWDQPADGTFGAPAFRFDGVGHYVLANGQAVKLTKAQMQENFAQYFPSTAANPWSATQLKRYEWDTANTPRPY